MMFRTRVHLRNFKYSNSKGRSLLPQQRLLSSSTLKDAPFVDIHPEVEAALAAGKPVVALETAIVTHGMPYPTNLETALSMESIVRSTGSVPATIGLISGRVKIGLTTNELEHLATARGSADVVKISRRDIGPAIAMKKDGGTTCAGTLVFAALAGIRVFSTGGWVFLL
jgi:pseudouridylate synthase / pseudouridine kinase